MHKASISVRYGKKKTNLERYFVNIINSSRVSTIAWKKEEEGRSGEDDVEKFKGDENKPKDAVETLIMTTLQYSNQLPTIITCWHASNCAEKQANFFKRKSSMRYTSKAKIIAKAPVNKFMI